MTLLTGAVSTETARIAALFIAVAVVAAAAVWMWMRRRPSPEKLERKRRAALHATGRIGDAVITEASGDVLFYTYTIRGVQYLASQDVTFFRDRLPADLERVAGPAGMKYAIANPINSMVICEEWTGLRRPESA